MIKSYDLGENLLVDQCLRFSIDDLLQKAKKSYIEYQVNQQIQALNHTLSVTYSKTRYNGYRAWFLCPQCNERRRDLYKHPLREAIGCRSCLNIKYRSQRYRGMIENSLVKY